jgi:hypothetical protein
MGERELVARIDSEGNDGAASLLVYRIGSQIEFVVTEATGADASVFLPTGEALKFLESVASSVRKDV